MSVSSVLPITANAVFSAYRPIIIQANATTTTEVVYCDIYINNVYYKTIAQYYPYSGNIYRFDIQDALQEYLNSPLPVMNQYNIQVLYGALVYVQCKLRGSTIAGTGFITPNGPVPVQGTVNTAPVPGGGLASNIFWVLNATLQHQDNQDLATHLQSYWPVQTNIPGGGTSLDPYTVGLYLLSHNTSNYVVRSNITGLLDSGWFPLLAANNCFNGYGSANFKLMVRANGVDYQLDAAWSSFIILHNNVYYIPYGLKQLSLSTGYSAIPWSTITQYKMVLQVYINRYNISTMTAYQGWVDGFISPLVTIGKSYLSSKRILFMNRLGQYDSVTFAQYDETFTVTSSMRELPLTAPPVSGSKSMVGKGKFNVRSNDNGILTGLFQEKDMPWIKELLESPHVFLEWQGTQGQADDYLPIVLNDAEYVTVKSDKCYNYLLQIKYSLANEHIIIRN